MLPTYKKAISIRKVLFILSILLIFIISFIFLILAIDTFRGIVLYNLPYIK